VSHLLHDGRELPSYQLPSWSLLFSHNEAPLQPHMHLDTPHVHVLSLQVHVYGHTLTLYVQVHLQVMLYVSKTYANAMLA